MQAPYKLCQRCGKAYEQGTRNRNQYAASKFCSIACSGLNQRNNLDKIYEHVVTDAKTNCHIWTGHKIRKGYGRVSVGKKRFLVHRFVWETIKGPVPEGLQLDHTCGVKACCNVDHLRAVTARENSLAATSNNMAARNFRRVVCPKCGGPYSAFPNGNRYCKPCRHARMMQYQRERRAAKKLERRNNFVI